MPSLLQPQPAPLPTPTDLILHHYLADALTIQQIAGELKLSIPEVLDVLRSPRTQEIIQQLRDAEKQRQQLLRAVAVTRALHTLTTLTDPEVGGSDRSLELQRKAAAALLREAASAARTQAGTQRAPRGARVTSNPPITINAAHHASTNISDPKPTAKAVAHPRSGPARGQFVSPLAHSPRDPRIRAALRRPSHHAARDAHLVRPITRRRAASPTLHPCLIFQHPPVRARYTHPYRTARRATRARSPPEHLGKTLKISLFEKSLFFLPLCWHRAVLEACSVWSDRNARSWGFGSRCAKFAHVVRLF